MKTKPVTEKVKIELNIKTGMASPAQKAAWTKFWRKLIADCNTQIKKEEKES
jgi:hypothetical protein